MQADVRALEEAVSRANRLASIVRLEVAGGSLRVVAVGTDCRVCTVVPAEGDLAGAYVLANPLASALHLRADDRPVELVVTETDLQVVHGEYRLNLPRVKTVPFNFGCDVPVAPLPAADLQTRLAQVAMIQAKDEPLGVLMEWRDGDLMFAAIKRGRHAHAVRLSCPPDASGRFCFSRTAADQILRLGEVVSWWESEGSVFFTSADSVLRVSPLRDGYPRDFGAVFEDDFVTSIEVEVAALKDAIRVVSVVLDSGDDCITLATVAQAGPGEAVVEVRGRALHGSAAATEKLLCRSDALVPWTGTCNVKDLIASLAVLEGEKVKVALGKRSILLQEGRFRALLSLLVGG